MDNDNNKSYSKYYYIRKSKINKAYLMTGVIMLFFVFLVIAASFKGGLPQKAYLTQTDICFYYLSINSFEDNVSATEFAKSSKNKGAAGYIYKDKKYHIIAAVYFDSKKAQSALTLIKQREPKAKLLAFSLSEINHGKINEQTTERIKITVNLIRDVLFMTNEISLQNSTPYLTLEKLRAMHKTLAELYNENLKNQSFTQANLQPLNSCVFKISSAISLAYGDLSESNLRYLNIEMCQIVLEMLKV